MARPVSWLPRLHEIQRSVANSVRSHYDRSDIERLFELSERAAARLMELLPATPVGTSRVIATGDLLRFLGRVKDTENLHALLAQMRAEKVVDSRRVLRTLVRRDVERMTLAEKPRELWFTRGRVEVDFTTVESLAQAMLSLALILETDGDEFARLYERLEENEIEERTQREMEKQDIQNMLAELREMEAAKGRAPSDEGAQLQERTER